MVHFVEKSWGIHFAMGGTGALVQALVRKFEELGGTICYKGRGCAHQCQWQGRQGAAKSVRSCNRLWGGVTLADGTRFNADLVASNADYANTYMKLIDSKYRFYQQDARVKLAQPSMSLVVIYFGFRSDELNLDLRHHNIILGPRYEELLRDIFDRKVLAEDFSQYLHIPSLTDSSLAPPGHHAAYTLVPVPHNGSSLDWSKLGEPFVEKVLGFLEEKGYIAGLCERLVYKSFITPDYFEHTINSWLGNGFGVEPILRQSAYFRPHNQSEDIKNLYLVGANTQPGGGTPAVMMSAKITARLIARNYSIPSDVVNGMCMPRIRAK